MPRVKPPPLMHFYNNEDEKLEIGIDEAGRGPLFGRVYTGAVVLPKDVDFDFTRLKDSKKFSSEKKINEVADYIKEHAIAWSVTYNDEKVIEETFQIDYTHPFGSSKKSSTSNSNKREIGGRNGHGRGGKGGGSSGISNSNKIEIGGKIINRDREMVYSNQGIYNNAELFNYSQLVSASYISTEFSLPHGLGMKTGLRYENTKTTGDWLKADSLSFNKKS